MGCLLQLNFTDGSPLPYLAYSELLNRSWCMKHDHRYESGPGQLPTGCHPIWRKVPLLQHCLEHAQPDELILYLDGDAWVFDMDLRLERLAAEVLPAPFVIACGEDQADRSTRWNLEDCQVGTMLLRNTDICRRIVSEWNNVPCYDVETREKWPVDQLGFNRHIRPRWSAFINRVPYQKLNGRDGTSIRHLMALPAQVRNELMAASWQRREQTGK